MIRKSNNRPDSGHPKTTGKKQSTGKRVGKSKVEKSNNQLNRRIKD